MSKIRYLLSFLCFVLILPLSAQTIIDLKRGGGVRAKTAEDYEEAAQIAERLRKDSLAYTRDLRLGFNALAADSLAAAEDFFKDALRKRPDAPGNYIVRYNLALVDMHRGENKRAASRLDDIIKEHPDYYDARLARAQANLQLGKASEAMQDAEILLSLDATKKVSVDLVWQARFVRAAARYALRLYSDARADIQLLLKEAPQNEGVRLLEALTLQKLGQPAEALNRLNLIVAAYPQSTDALRTRASVLAEMNKPALAKADYDALIALAPTESDYYIERARMLIQLGEKTAARRDLDIAVKLGVPQGVVQSLYLLTR